MREYVRRYAWWGIALILGGCAGETIAQPPPTSQPTVVTTEQAPTTNRFKLKLTLSAPEDLKVREGDTVKANQILADRTRDRARLLGQKRLLQLQIAKLSQPAAAPPPRRPIPEVTALPSPSFLSEVAAIDQAKLKAAAVERSRNQQQRKLDLLKTMPSSEIPEATVPHEEEVLKLREQELGQANADIEFAKGKLAQAQSDRQHQEYLHSMEMSRRAISMEQAALEYQAQLQHQEDEERDRGYELAQLTAKLQELDTQIAQLSAIRSPYDGTVQRVKFLGQADQSLSVELVLVISSGNGKAAAPTPAAEAGNGAETSSGAEAKAGEADRAQ